MSQYTMPLFRLNTKYVIICSIAAFFSLLRLSFLSRSRNAINKIAVKIGHMSRWTLCFDGLHSPRYLCNYKFVFSHLIVFFMISTKYFCHLHYTLITEKGKWRIFFCSMFKTYTPIECCFLFIFTTCWDPKYLLFEGIFCIFELCVIKSIRIVEFHS